jgi:hypothetical protein
MNLATHAAVLWRFRAVTITGILLGIILAVIAAYKVGWDGGPSLEPRGSETWTSESSLLVTQAGFPEGRVILPETPPPGTVPTTPDLQPDTGDKKLQFADPLRFALLAQLYAQLAVSDRVLEAVPGKPDRDQIEALTVEGPAATQLPVIQLTTTAASAVAAKDLNTNLVKALQDVLASDQERADISSQQRTRVELLSAPAAPTKTAGRTHTASILALLLCLIGAVAVAHLLAAIRDRREGGWGEADTGIALTDEPFGWDDDDGANAIIVPWSAGGRGDEPDAQSTVPVTTNGGGSTDVEQADPPRASKHRRSR